MDQYPKLDHRLNKELVKEAVLGNSFDAAARGSKGC